MRFRTDASTKTLEVTTLQAIVLHVFNQMPEAGQPHTVASVAAATGLPVAFVKSVLHSLSCAANKHILAKTPRNSRITDSDSFTVNGEFKSAGVVSTCHGDQGWQP